MVQFNYSKNEKNMNTVKVWDVFVRIFHLTLVGTMIGLYWSGETYKNLHIYLGYWVIYSGPQSLDSFNAELSSDFF